MLTYIYIHIYLYTSIYILVYIDTMHAVSAGRETLESAGLVTHAVFTTRFARLVLTATKRSLKTCSLSTSSTVEKRKQ